MPQLATAVLAASLLVPIQEPGGTEAPTTVIEGRVVDQRGEPVPLAEITVATWEQLDVALAKGTCDGDGSFRIGRVPPRESWLVEARGKGRCGVGVITADRVGPMRIQLRDVTTVRGVLRDSAGKPVAGAAVRADLPLEITELMLIAGRRAPRTDDGGAFTLQDVPLGTVRFVAVVPGEGLVYFQQWIRGAADLVLSPDPTSLTTNLQVAIEGVPPDALASVRTSVTLVSDAGGPVRLPPPWDAPVFDREARFELQRVLDGEYWVSVQADGFVFSPVQGIAKAGAGPHRLRFSATPVQQCPARVCDRDGAPVAGIRCEVKSGSRRAFATSALDGTMTFTGPAPSGSPVEMRSLDKRWYGSVRGTVDPTTTLQLRVVPACRVRGRIVQADGRPASFAAVVLRVADADARRLPIQLTVARATVDRDGNVEFGGMRYRRDRVCLAVAGEYGAGIGEPFALAESGDVVAAPPLQLHAAATIAGKVTDAAGPAPGVRVKLRTSDFGKRDLEYGDEIEVITDREGRYRFVGVPPGRAAIEIASIGKFAESRRVVEPFEVEAGKSYSFDLVRGQ